MKKKIIKIQICPLCEGKGAIDKIANGMREVVGSLRNKKLTVRQIMVATGLKSPSAVFYYFPQKEIKKLPPPNRETII